MQGSGHCGAVSMADGAGPGHKSDADRAKSWWRGYVQSDLDTKMLVSLRSTDTPAQMKAKIESAHFANFPSMGRVRAGKLLISAFGSWWSFDDGECDSFSCSDSLLKVQLTRLEDEAHQSRDDERIQDQPMNNVVDGQQKTLVLPSPDGPAVAPSSEILEKVKDPSSEKQDIRGAGPENEDLEAENVSTRPDFASRAVVVSDLLGQIFSQDSVQKSRTEASENGKAEEKFDNKRTASIANLQDRSEEVKKVKVDGAEEEQRAAGLTHKEMESPEEEDSEEERDAEVDRLLTRHFPESSSFDRSSGGGDGKKADEADATSKEIAFQSQISIIGNSKNDSDSDDTLDPTEEKDELPGAVTDSVPLKDEATTKLGTYNEDSDSGDQSGEGVGADGPSEQSVDEETAPLDPKAVSESSPDSSEDGAGSRHDNPDEETPGPAPLDSKAVSENNPDKETSGPAPLDPKAVSENSSDEETLDPKAVLESSSESSGDNAGCGPLSQRPLSQPTNLSEPFVGEQEEEEEMSGLARFSHHAAKSLSEQASPSSSGSSGQENAAAYSTQAQQQEESGLLTLSRRAENLARASSSQAQRKSSVKSASAERSESESSDDSRGDQKAEAEEENGTRHGASGFSDNRATRGLLVETEQKSNKGGPASSSASSGSSSSVSSEDSGGSEWTPAARSRRTIDSRNQHFVEDKNGLSKLLTITSLKRRSSPEGKNKDKQATEEARQVHTPKREVKAGKPAEMLKKDEQGPNMSQPTRSIDSRQSEGKARRDPKTGSKSKPKQVEVVKGATAREKPSKEDPGGATGGDDKQKMKGMKERKNKKDDANKDSTAGKLEQHQAPRKESTDNQDSQKDEAEVEAKVAVQPSKRVRKEKKTEGPRPGRQKQLAPEAEAALQNGAQRETTTEAEAEQQHSPRRSRRKKAVAATSEDERSGQGTQGDEEQTQKKRRRKEERDGDEEPAPEPALEGPGAGRQKQVAAEAEAAQQNGAEKEMTEVPERAEPEAEQQHSPKRSRRKKAVAATSEDERSGQGTQGDDEQQTQKKRRKKRDEKDERAPEPALERPGPGRQKQVAAEAETAPAQQNGAQKETTEVPERAEPEAEQQHSAKRSRRKKAVAATSEDERSGQRTQGDDEQQTQKTRRRKKEEEEGDEEPAPAPKKQKTPSRGAKVPNEERAICACGRSYVRKTSNYYSHVRSCQTAISAGVTE